MQQTHHHGVCRCHSLSIAKPPSLRPSFKLRTESPGTPDAQLPMQVIRRNGTVSKFDAGKIRWR